MFHEAGHYYHVYNRGCNRENIFVSDENYRYLVSLAKRFLVDSSVSVVAYCFMPNHYHFLLYTKLDHAIGKFIQRLFNTYTQAFNRQQSRSGTLFEGRAQSLLVDDEKYAIHVCRYIHLNPVAAHLVARPEDWVYSNYLDWIGKRSSGLIDREFVQAYFPRVGDYEKFIVETMDEVIALKVRKYLVD